MKVYFKQPDFYYLLGFRHFPIDPNDWGIVVESDNPCMIYNLRSAQIFKAKIDPEFNALYGYEDGVTIVPIYL